MIRATPEKCTVPAQGIKGPQVQWVSNSFVDPDEDVPSVASESSDYVPNTR